MSPSKLDKYLNILEVLIEKPKKADYIARRAHVEPHVLKRQLNFLVSNGVIEKRRLGNKLILYAITERGLAVFKTLRALKYLEKLRDSLPILDEAREITAMLSKHRQSGKKNNLLNT